MTYSGYFNLFPRLVASLAAIFSATYAPAIYATAAIGMTGWSAATIASANLRFAWIFGALLTAAPHSGEVFGQLLNAQWLMAPALAVIIATPPPVNAIWRANQLLFVSIASFTGPFSIFAAPICVWRLFRWRRRYDVATCAICLLGAAVQLAAVGSGSHSDAQAPSLAMAWIVADHAFGELTSTMIITTPGQVIAPVAVLAIAITAFARKGSPWLKVAVFSLFMTLSVWVMKFKDESDYQVTLQFWYGDRYFYMPRLLLLWTLVDSVLGFGFYSMTIIYGLYVPMLALPLLALAIYIDALTWVKPPFPVFPWEPAAMKIDNGEAVKASIPPPGWVVALPATHGPQVARPSR